MKSLGLVGAGIASSTAITPKVFDLDELAASGEIRKYPWFVKEIGFKNPTVEVDWKLLKSYDSNNVYKFTTEETEQMVQNQLNTMKKGVANNTPGMTLRDFAVLEGLRTTMLSVPLTRDEPSFNYTTTAPSKPAGYTRKDLGWPKWELNPEENLRTLASAIHLFGGRDISAIEVDEDVKKIFFSNASNKAIRFEDIDAPIETASSISIPNKCKWMVVFTIPQSRLSGFSHVTTGKYGVYGGYSDAAVMMTRIQGFIRAMGWLAVNKGGGTGSQIASNTGFGVVAGNGELGRCDYVLSPKYGALIRLTEFFLTDMPLSPTPPIDAGMWRFCQTCKKCGSMCPSSAISLENEPTWEPSGPWNGTGRKCYPINYKLCLPWRGMPGHGAEAGTGGCSQCQVACVFTKLNDSSIHDVIKGTVATTGIFDSFFRTMDDAFGYGKGFTSPINEIFFSPEQWWNRDLDKFPFKGRVVGDGWE
ncbi:reductive dehalogenase [Dehalogenimonas sp. THU2]|uniref:reductive dehalogenase n=1 Tax=Dehalogenimonas sp. THU2 TaxID=3151121 RepID=UPI003218939F